MQEPRASIQHLQFSPGEHGRWHACAVGEDLADVGGPPQGLVMHEERHAIEAEEEVRCC